MVDTQPAATAPDDLSDLVPPLTQAAEAGNAEAAFRLGLLHCSGDGVPLNYVKGAEWIQIAAEKGFTEAQRYMAWLHAGGLGVEQDNSETQRWYLMAAEAGDLKAQTICGHFYQTGKYGAKKDVKEMLRWYQSAAAEGYADAEYALGRMLAEGKVLQQNDEAAFQWLSLALFHQSVEAQEALKELTERLDAETLAAYKERMMQKMSGS